MKQLPLFALIPLSLAACKVEPAPEDVDGLAHYMWQHYDDETTEALHEGIVNLHAAIGGDAIDGVTDGTISALSQEELDLVGYGDKDAAKLSGVYMTNVIGCSLDELEWQIYAANQDELHEGTYTAYDRAYGEDVEAFEAGEIDELTWVTTYSVEGFGASYTASLDGSLRRLEPIDASLSPYGTVLISRGLLQEPAFFDDDGERGLYQDYQLEIYYERAPGEVVHVYPIWREMIYLGDADFSSDTVQRFVLDGLADWDDDAAALCAE